MKNVIKMIFRFNVLYFLILGHTTSSELILKIDLNESTDTQTTANYLYITFVNTTDSEQMVDDDENNNLNKYLNGKHQVIKRNPENDPMYVSLNLETFNHPTNLQLPNHPNSNIPLVQMKGDNAKIKKYLDDFKMSKRRTYMSTPNYNFPFKDIIKYESDFEENDFRRSDVPNFISQMRRENKIFDVISKQNKLIERIANKVRETEKRKKKIVRTIFDDILESVETRQSTTSKVTTTTTTNTDKLSTVLTVIDETEIRNALKKDPFINRILRLAGRKKKEYEAKIGRENGFLF